MRIRSVRSSLIAGAVFLAGAAPISARAEVVPTTIHAHGIIATIEALQPGTAFALSTYGAPVAASLRVGTTPLAGKTLVFSASGETICSAVTDQGGEAACTDDETSAALAAIVSAGGYRASFAGDEEFAASSERGVLASAFLNSSVGEVWVNDPNRGLIGGEVR